MNEDGAQVASKRLWLKQGQLRKNAINWRFEKIKSALSNIIIQLINLT